MQVQAVDHAVLHPTVEFHAAFLHEGKLFEDPGIVANESFYADQCVGGGLGAVVGARLHH
jgi:hypothetical protein